MNCSRNIFFIALSMLCNFSLYAMEVEGLHNTIEAGDNRDFDILMVIARKILEKKTVVEAGVKRQIPSLQQLAFERLDESLFTDHLSTINTPALQKAYKENIYLQLPSEKQNAVIDHLYKTKYNPALSPLWKEVKKVSDEKDFEKRDVQAIADRLRRWQLDDPAQSLFTLLATDESYPLKLKYGRMIKSSPGLHGHSTKDYFSYYALGKVAVHCYDGDNGWHAHDTTTRLVKKTAHGCTELPLILALSHCKTSSPDGGLSGPEIPITFKCPITTLYDVDIQALKELNDRSVYITFGDIAQNARISEKLYTLNNITIECNLRPDAMKPYCKNAIKVNSGDHDYWPSEVQRYVKDDHHRPLEPYSMGLIKRLYYTPEDYWYLKAIGTIGLFCGIVYCAKKCIDECDAFISAEESLRNQAISDAFNSNVKPLLTADTIAALQVTAYHKPLPALLADQVGDLQGVVPISSALLDSAQTIIEQTNGVMNASYPIDTTTIQTPLGIGSSIGEGYLFFGLGMGVAHYLMAIGLRLREGPRKDVKQTSHQSGYIINALKKCIFFPVYVLDYLIALPAAILKPKWLPYYINHKLQLIFPCKKDQD